MTFATYHGKTFDEMSRDELIQALLDVGGELDRIRTAAARKAERDQQAAEAAAWAPPQQRRHVA